MQLDLKFIRDSLKVGFYSVQDVSITQPTEYNDFRRRMLADGGKKQRQLGEIDKFIERIGKNGASPDFFRTEGVADALPPTRFRFFDSDGVKDMGLRNYCIVPSQDIVILLNGDLKTTQNPRDCPNCGKHFDFANDVAKSFYEALYVDKAIELDGKYINILTDEDFFINI